MYKRTSRGWVKHLDFIVIDVLCLQVAFFLAYVIRQNGWNPYASDLYRAIGILLIIFDLLVAVMTDSMHNVTKRGYYRELVSSVRHCAVVLFLTILWMFSQKNSDTYSRVVVFLTFGFHLVIGYGARVFWKYLLKRYGSLESGKYAMLALLEPDLAHKMVKRLTSNPLEGYHLAGIVLTENPDGLIEIDSIPVVCSFEEASNYICREWIDSVFLSTKGVTPEVRAFMNRCAEMAR